MTSDRIAKEDYVDTAVALKAPLASPALTGSPTAPTQSPGDSSTLIATDAFVAAAIAAALAGLDVKPDVAYAATSALPACTYANGTSGVGATLTGNSNGPLIIDGVTILVAQAGQRVLITAQAAPAQDGWYVITQVGVVAVSPFILTRATESDQAAEIGAGYLTGVVAPNGVTAGANNGKLYVSVAANPFVVGTTALTFSQVGSTYSAGTGIGLSGTTFSIDTAVTVDKTTAQTLTNKTLTSPVLNTGVSGTAVDTDATMAANSDTILPSQKAVKTALATKAPTNPLATDTLWAAAGDVVIGTGNDAAAILSATAAAGAAHVMDPGATNKVSVQYPHGLEAASRGATGALATTYDRRFTLGSAVVAAPTSGTLRLYGMLLPKGLPVTNITFYSGTTALSVGTHQWFGLFDASRVVLAKTADDTSTAWGASAAKTLAVTGGPYVVTATGWYYIGYLITATTLPTIESVASLPTAGSRLAAPIASGNSTAGLTDPASCTGTQTALTIIGSFAYAEIS